jgi:tetratricopeptide (TPR) repeat protein
MDWGLRAEPIIIHEACPDVQRESAENAVASNDLKGPVEAGLLPAIRVWVDVQVGSGNGAPPCIWPGAETLRILRLAPDGGEPQTVIDVPREQLALLRPYTSGAYGTRMPTIQVGLIDREPALGRKSAYRAEFLDADGNTLAKSGTCTAAAVPLKPIKTAVDAQNTVSFELENAASSTAAFDSEPDLFLSSAHAALMFTVSDDDPQSIPGEFWRQPAGAASVRYAVRLTPFHYTQGEHVFVGLEGLQTVREWRLSEGEYMCDRSFRIARRLTTPDNAPVVLPERASPPFPAQPAEPVSQPETGTGKLRALEAGGATVHITAPRYDLYGGQGPDIALQMRTTYDVSPHHGVHSGFSCMWPQIRPTNYRFVSVAATVAGRKRTFFNANQATNALMDCLAPRGDHAEPITITGTFDFNGTTAEVVLDTWRAPRLSQVRATGMDNAVRISWQPIETDKEAWASGPTIIVERIPQMYTTRVNDGLTIAFPPAPRVVFRGPADAGMVVDKTVTNGQAYLYRVRLTGRMRLTKTAPAASKATVHVPVHVGTDCVLPGSQCGWIVAAPAPPHVLAVAVVADDWKSPESAILRSRLTRALADARVLRITQRYHADALYDEVELGRAATANEQTGPESADVRPADIVLLCRVRPSARGKIGEVVLIDYLNGTSAPAASQPLTHIDWDQLKQDVLSTLRPYAQEMPPPDATSAGDMKEESPRSIAFLPPTAVGTAPDAKITPGTLLELLVAQAAMQTDVVTLDRSSLSEVQAELERAGMTGSDAPFDLGAVCTARMLVSGYYAFQDGQVHIWLHPIDVHTGINGETVHAAAPADRLENAVADAIRKLADSLPETENTPPSPPLVRFLESRITSRGGAHLKQAKRKVYVADRNGADLVTLGHQYANAGKFNEAIDAYREVLDRDKRSQTATITLYRYIDNVLKRMDTPRERIENWKDAVQCFQRQNQSPADAAVELADILLDNGRTAEAIKALELAPDATDSHRLACLWERAQIPSKSLDIFLNADWHKHRSYSPYNRTGMAEPLNGHYASLQRILRTASPEVRHDILTACVTKLAASHPYQSLKALRALAAENTQTDDLATYRLQACRALRDCEGILETCRSLAPEQITGKLLLAVRDAALSVRRYGNAKDADRIAQLVYKSPDTSAPATTSKQMLRGLLERHIQRPGDDADKIQPRDALLDHIGNNGGHQLGAWVYALDTDGVLRCIDPTSGRPIWQADLVPVPCRYFPKAPGPKLADVTGGPKETTLLRVLDAFVLATPEAIIVASPNDGVLHAFDTEDGHSLWRLVAWSVLSPPHAAPKNRVLVADGFGGLYVLNRADGSVIKYMPGPPELEEGYREYIPDLVLSKEGAAPVNGLLGSDPRHGVRVDFHQERSPGDNRPMPKAPHGYGLYANETHVFYLESGTCTSTNRTLGATRRDRRRQEPENNANPKTVAQRLKAILKRRDRALFVPALLQMINDSTREPRDRTEALMAFAEIAPEAAAGLAVDLLVHDSADLRRVALHCLRWKLHVYVDFTPVLVARLLEYAELNQDSGHSECDAAQLLAELGGVFAADAVGKLYLESASPRAWTWALGSQHFRSPAWRPLLQQIARDNPNASPKQVAEALAAAGDPQARQTILENAGLEQLLKDAEEFLALPQSRRTRAEQSAFERRMQPLINAIVGCAHSEECIPLLTKLVVPVDADSTGFNGNLARAFYEIGSKESLRALLNLACDTAVTRLSGQTRDACTRLFAVGPLPNYGDTIVGFADAWMKALDRICPAETERKPGSTGRASAPL